MEPKTYLHVAAGLAKLLDSQFTISGFKFGLDLIIGLIPGFGDAVSLMLSLYLVWIASQMRIPSHVISKMIGNVFFDFFLGLIPVLGDVSDFFYKANIKNLELLYKYQSAPVIEGSII